MAAGAALIRIARGARRTPPLRPLPEVVPAGSVSVVIPARNEEQRLGPCLDALATDPQVTEVVVVDDESADGTAALARRAGARVVAGAALPDGWVGKPWALQQGLEAATGDWVLALDADTRPQPGLVGAALAAAARHDLDLLSLGGRYRCDGTLEQALHASMLATLVYRFGPPGTARARAARRSERTGGRGRRRRSQVAERRQERGAGARAARRSERTGGRGRRRRSQVAGRRQRGGTGRAGVSRVVANGQCTLARRSWLVEAGGYRAAAGHLTDDVALARAFAARGARVGMLDGSAVLEVDMHASAAEVWREWGRSLPMPDVTRPAWQVADLVVVWLAMALPALRLLSGRGRGRGLDLVLLAVRLGLVRAVRRSYRPPRLGLALSPLLDAATVARVTWTALRPVKTWRGRSYAHLSDSSTSTGRPG